MAEHDICFPSLGTARSLRLSQQRHKLKEITEIRDFMRKLPELQQDKEHLAIRMRSRGVCVYCWGPGAAGSVLKSRPTGRLTKGTRRRALSNEHRAQGRGGSFVVAER